MEYTTNNDKMLEAVLTDPDLMKFGDYNPAEISSIYQAVDSDNVVVSVVAQIIKRSSEQATEREIYKDNIKLNLSYSVPKNIVYIDNGHKSGKFKFYTLSFSAIITGNEVNGFIDFCLKNKVRFLV